MEDGGWGRVYDLEDFGSLLVPLFVVCCDAYLCLLSALQLTDSSS